MLLLLDLMVDDRVFIFVVVDLHFGFAFYREEPNTGKRKSTLNMCNAQYVCMININALILSPRT